MRNGTLSLTRGLLNWLAADPAWAALPMQRRAMLHWQATLGSINAGLARLNAPAAAQTPMLQAPLLVLGPWRSGTTVMHELLAAATGLATPRTWQCMNATAFTTTPPRRRGVAAVARPMDGLAISADSPQEDEFALLTLGADSAYRAFWMPHRISELHTTLDPAHWLAHPQWLAPWEAFLRGVLATSGSDSTQPLILKSPNHTYRIASIVRRFPAARFVWMLRDPMQLYFSNRKMWSAMFTTHGLTEVQPDALDAFLARMLHASAQVLRDALAGAAQGRWVFVSHEALLARPGEVVDDIGERLQLPRAPSRDALHAALDRIRHGRVERYSQAIPPEAEFACAELAAAHRIALASRHAIQ